MSLGSSISVSQWYPIPWKLVTKLRKSYNAAQTVKRTRQLHRFVPQPQSKLFVYSTILQALPPTEIIIAKSISSPRCKLGNKHGCTVSDEFGDSQYQFYNPPGPEKQFHWPTKADTCWSSNILCVIEAPILSSSSLQKYINPIWSGLFQTANDPGGGGL